MLFAQVGALPPKFPTGQSVTVSCQSTSHLAKTPTWGVVRLQDCSPAFDQIIHERGNKYIETRGNLRTSNFGGVAKIAYYSYLCIPSEDPSATPHNFFNSPIKNNNNLATQRATASQLAVNKASSYLNSE